MKIPYIILAGIGYPPAVAEADPNNCAESVSAIMDAGLRMKAWRGIDANHCRAVAFFRLPTRARTGTHDVALYTLRSLQDSRSRNGRGQRHRRMGQAQGGSLR